MTAERNRTMTLDEVMAEMFDFINEGVRPYPNKIREWAWSVHAHLATREAVVSDGIQARYRLPGEEWSSWGHVVNGVKGHEMELRTALESLATADENALVYKWLAMAMVCTSDEVGSAQASVFHHCARELRAALAGKRVE